MEQKDFLRVVIVLFLGFTCVLDSITAVPDTSSLKSTEDNPSPVQNLLTQETIDLSDGNKEMIGFTSTEGRMILETTDYPGTGANNRHDPPGAKP